MDIIGQEYMTWNDNEIEIIYNDQFQDETLVSGGYNPKGDKCIVFVPVASFPDDDRPSQREIVTVKDREWRIDTVSVGDVRYELTLIATTTRE